MPPSLAHLFPKIKVCYVTQECEVSVHTDLNVYRRETANNVWVVVTNRPPQEKHWSVIQNDLLQYITYKME